MRITHTFVLATVLAGGVLAMPAVAGAQSRGGGHAGAAHGGAVAAPRGGAVAAPRGGAPAPGGPVAVPRPGYPAYGYPGYGHPAYGHYPYYGYGYGYHYPYYGYPYYGYGYPCCGYPYYGYGGVSIGFGIGFGWGSIGFGYGYPSYGYAYPYAPYPYYGASYVVPVQTSGGVRIDVPQRDAEVTVDGYYAGTVEDFNGRTQQLNLQPGAHHVEVRANGFEPLSFDVNIEPGKTVTYRTQLRPALH
jgi:hypothetical protein